MKRIVMFLMSTLTVLVLLFGYHTSTSSKMAAASDFSAVAPVRAGTTTEATSSPSSTVPSTGSTVATTPADSTEGTSSTTLTTASPTTTTSSSSTASTVTGSAADTRWGPVQVKVTVNNGKIINVEVVEYPNGNGKDLQINAEALPILVQETLTAQSAKIDMVSGATVTSGGYVTSLQSALDQAGLA
ncbi:MAG: FMN-binding protein [Actinomycetota bacterium]|nr:FMN-binding protein [Actinomycetota bacterium]